jgi:hypothetical protein
MQKKVGNLSLYYSEYNDGLWTFPTYHDTPYASSFIIKTAMDGNGIVLLAITMMIMILHSIL